MRIKLVGGPRGSGRTSELIEWAKAEERGGPSRYIVSASQREGHEMFRRVIVEARAADEANPEAAPHPTIRMPITIHEAMHWRGYRAVFAIDDADRILTSLVTEPIAMVSWEGRNPATMEAPRNVKPENAGQLEIYEARS